MTNGDLAEIIILNSIRLVIFSLVGIMGVIGFILCAPFPSFWKEILDREHDET